MNNALLRTETARAPLDGGAPAPACVSPVLGPVVVCAAATGAGTITTALERDATWGTARGKVLRVGTALAGLLLTDVAGVVGGGLFSRLSSAASCMSLTIGGGDGVGSLCIGSSQTSRPPPPASLLWLPLVAHTPPATSALLFSDSHFLAELLPPLLGAPRFFRSLPPSPAPPAPYLIHAEGELRAERQKGGVGGPNGVSVGCMGRVL